MNNTGKHLGIVVLAVIVLSMTATAGAYGQSLPPTIPWPADSVWGLYGVSGLRQPSGTQVHGQVQTGTFNVILTGANKAVYDNLVGQISGMGGVLLQETTTDEAIMTMFVTSNQRMVVVTFVAKENAVNIVAQ